MNTNGGTKPPATPNQEFQQASPPPSAAEPHVRENNGVTKDSQTWDEQDRPPFPAVLIIRIHNTAIDISQAAKMNAFMPPPPSPSKPLTPLFQLRYSPFKEWEVAPITLSGAQRCPVCEE